MNSQQFAVAISNILPRANMPVSPENVQAAGQIFDILGKMARGELILVDAPRPVPTGSEE